MAWPTAQDLARQAQRAIAPRVSGDLWDSGIEAARRGTRLAGAGALFANRIGASGPAAPGSIDSYIAAQYPYLAAFLDNPEIGPILRQAAKEGWDEVRLFGAVQRTNWWRTSSSASREWDDLIATDPGEAANRAAQTAAMIQNRARTLGLSMSAGTIQGLAIDATRNGWTDAQVVDRLIQSVNWASLQGGDLTALRDTVKAIAGNYLVRVSEETARDYAAAIASGEMSEQGVASIMQRQAVARFGWMADVIEQGVTPSQYLAPIRDTIADELELAPDAVNLMDPKWLGMVETRDEAGGMRAATQNEARLSARRDPGWRNTQRAQELVASAATAIADVFGRRSI